MIELDGAHGEGGGQLLRTALSLSALSGRGMVINDIRAGRPDPGLRPQHLAGVRLIKELCSAQVQGDQVGSRRLEFVPGPLRAGRHRFDVGTAGSLTLLMQTVLPALALSPGRSELELVGGTDVRWSPPVDHYRLVLFPMLRRMGLSVDMAVPVRGFYPRGGGRAVLRVGGGALRGLLLEERGELLRIGGISFVQNLPSHVAERMARAAGEELPEGTDLERQVLQGPSAGAGVVLAAEYRNTVLGWNALGARGVPAERVGREAALGLKEEMEGGGTLDLRTADQLLPFMALSGEECGFSVREVSGHLGTQLWLLPQFLPVRCTVDDGSPRAVRVSRT
jgi:RNA 3'-phosphate cyclase